MTQNLQFFFFMFIKRLMKKRLKSLESSIKEPCGFQPITQEPCLSRFFWIRQKSRFVITSFTG